MPQQEQPHLEAVMRMINHLLMLNRASRRIIKNDTLPCVLWPRILARSSDSPDAIYFFLGEKPDILVKKPPVVSRKRKRDWWSVEFVSWLYCEL